MATGCWKREVTCLLGDNGAGTSTLIKTLAGVHKPSEGKYFFEGEETLFELPREALNAGIATVYQDLAMIPLMSIWRNFFLGSEPLKAGPIFDIENAIASPTARRRRGLDFPCVNLWEVDTFSTDSIDDARQ